MSKLVKLEQKFSTKAEETREKQLLAFFKAMGELQFNCKHEKTHWIQEISKEGIFSVALYKRCFICGSTVEKIDLKTETQEQILVQFDSSVEQAKLAVLNNPKGTEE